MYQRAPTASVARHGDARSIELEVGERVVKLTNPDKVLFPKARKTKRDLAEYYIAVGEGIVRALLRAADAAAPVPRRHRPAR